MTKGPIEWRRGRATLGWVLALLLPAGGLWAQQENAQTQPATVPLAIVTDALPRLLVNTPYSFRLAARGGTPPYTWSIEKGNLPRGLRLEEKSGVITGVPASAAELEITVQVSDSAEPPARALRELKITAIPALQLEWQRHPALENDGIYGEVKVGNPSKDAYDLTFIIVAINQIGKAFALGYQHFTLRPQTTQAIPFGSSLPLGSYVVHADAVGEIAAKNVIRRAQLQAPEPLVKK